MKKLKLLLAITLGISTISLAACEDPVYYTVTFNTLGGTEVESQTVKKNSHAIRPEINPERNGYTFDDWTYHGSLFDFENTKITSDITIKAKYNAITYTITYNYSQEGNTNTNPTTYTAEDVVTLYAPSYTIEHYQFAYYQDQNGFQYNGKINKGTIGDLVLTDVWEGKNHKVSGDSESFQGLGDYKYGDEVKLKYLKETQKGFTNRTIYVTYYYPYTQLIFKDLDFSFTMPDTDVGVSVHFDPIIYFIEYELDGGTNNSNNPNCVTIYSYDEVLPLYAPTKAGYTFAYWTYNDAEISELNVANYIDTITAGGPRNIVAHWEAN